MTRMLLVMLRKKEFAECKLEDVDKDHLEEWVHKLEHLCIGMIQPVHGVNAKNAGGW